MYYPPRNVSAACAPSHEPVFMRESSPQQDAISFSPGIGIQVLVYVAFHNCSQRRFWNDARPSITPLRAAPRVPALLPHTAQRCCIIVCTSASTPLPRGEREARFSGVPYATPPPIHAFQKRPFHLPLIAHNERLKVDSVARAEPMKRTDSRGAGTEEPACLRGSSAGGMFALIAASRALTNWS